MKIKQALVPAVVVSLATSRGMKLPSSRGLKSGKLLSKPSTPVFLGAVLEISPQKGATSTDSNTIAFPSDDHWEAWLDKFHDKESLVWVKFAKIKSGIESVTYDQAVNTGLCYGWIDSTRKKVDENYFIQRFSPRRKKSNWSLVNKNKVKDLVAAGRMKPAGMAQVEAAKADGRWDANN